MRHSRIATGVAVLVAMLAAPSTAAASPEQPQRDLAGFVEQIVDTLPGEGSDAFVDGPAVEAEQAALAIELARAGAVDESRGILDPLGYELVDAVGSDGQPYWVAWERTPCARCWGTFVVNPSVTARDVFVEVPHPLHDLHTPELGVEAFERTEASLLLLAGTHRFANGRPVDACRGVESDMARNDHSLFMAVHRLAGEGTVALQYHGFADRDGYPDVVLSDGSDTPPHELDVLGEELAEREISAGVFDGTQWTDLGATCNPQGKHSRATGGLFVHMEYRLAVRADPEARTATVEAVLDALFWNVPARSAGQ